MEGPKLNLNTNIMDRLGSQRKTYSAILCNYCKSNKCFICSKPLTLGKDARIG